MQADNRSVSPPVQNGDPGDQELALCTGQGQQGSLCSLGDLTRPDKYDCLVSIRASRTPCSAPSLPKRTEWVDDGEVLPQRRHEGRHLKAGARRHDVLPRAIAQKV